MSANKSRRKYDSEFKREALAHIESSGKSVSEVAVSLGIERELLYRWRMQARKRGDVAFPGNGRQGLTATEQKIFDLEKRARDAEEERDILKKAVAIFSKASK
jgi:transposase